MAVAPLLLICLCAIAKAEADPACRSEWLPLEAGNYWVYRSDSRFVSGSYRTVRVLGPYELDGQVWCQLEDSGRSYFLRSALDGLILTRGVNNSAETVYLDPRGLTSRAFTSPLGFSAQAIDIVTSSLFNRNTVTYASGIGKVTSVSTITTGSNGGFSEGDMLVEASVGGKTYRSHARGQAEISLDLNDTFANCAVPCYYAACGIGSPVDPPNAIKPCLGARAAGSDIANNSLLQLTVADSSGTTVFDKRVPLYGGSLAHYESLPFYSQGFVGTPITLFAPGDYYVTLWLIDPSGKLIAAVTKVTKLN